MTLARIGIELARIAPAVSVLLAMIAGCADEGIDRGPDGGAVAFDASFPGSDGGSAPPEQDQLCYDQVDNDQNGAIDCDEDACRADSACCVGSGDPACCAADGVTARVSFDCADGALDACFAGESAVRAFGDVRPIIEDGALVPQGGAAYGGVVIGPAIDARAQNVAFEATIEVPGSRCADCVDGAGIAILDEVPADGEHARVRFGVLVTGSRDELIVLAFDEPIARRPITAGAARYRIELDVNGDARALVDGEELARVRGVELPARAFVALFGRTQNRGAGEAAIRVRDATLTTHACDAPAALMRRDAPVLPWSGASWAPREVRGPSVVQWESGDERHTLMAFAHDGQIYLAERTGAGEFRNASFDPGPPAVELPAGVTAHDPWLVIDEGHLVLYFTAADARGGSSIWRSDGGADHALTFGAPAPVLDPAHFGFTGVDGASVLASSSEWTMVVRAHAGRGHRLMRFVSDDGRGWTFYGASVEAATLREPRTGDLFAFDRDELAAPALVRFEDARGRMVERLYYAGRRGTSWSIGLLASSDGVHWVPVGSVLGPGNGFDALGVTDPAPLVEDGALQLYYAGTDGDQFRIGLAGPIGTTGE